MEQMVKQDPRSQLRDSILHGGWYMLVVTKVTRAAIALECHTRAHGDIGGSISGIWDSNMI